MSTTEPPSIGTQGQQLAATAHQAVRDLTHLTAGCPPVPAPEVYEVLGTLKCLGYSLEQTLRQLARSLAASLTVYAVYEEDGGNPEDSVAYAMDSIRAGADHASRLGEILDAAQADISRQGYHQPRRETGMGTGTR